MRTPPGSWLTSRRQHSFSLKETEVALDALVTHGWSRISYNIVRSLGRQGLRVAVGTDGQSGMARFSKYAAARFRHPNFATDPDGFVEAVEAAMDRFRPAVYLPSEEEVFVVARHREQLEAGGVRIPIDDSATLELLNDKNRVLELAAELDIPVPKTIQPQRIEDVTRFRGEVGHPVVVKIHGTSGARGVYYVEPDDGPDRLDGILRKHDADYGGFVVQEYVRGRGWGVSMLCRRGEILRTFTHRRIRERIHTGGPSTIRESARNAQLEQWAQRLLGSVGFTGVAMVEFKRDSNGESWLIEVNPRFWGSVGLAVAAGVDFPYLLYRVAKGESLARDAAYEVGVTAKWLLGDVYSRWDHRRAGLRTNGAGSADCYDDLFWDDPLPFAAQTLLYARKRVFPSR